MTDFNAAGGETSVTTIAENLDAPWSIAFVDDNEALVSERSGAIQLLNWTSALPATVTKMHGFSNVGASLARADCLASHCTQIRFQLPRICLLHPRLADDVQNRVSYFTFNGTHFYDETVVLDGIPYDGFHNGGRIKFHPSDGTLYVLTGDVQHSGVANLPPNSAPLLNSTAGKILRINDDGTIPADNLFSGSAIYSYGHRNPQGLDWHSGTRQLYASEHGSNGNDEINRILAGQNYGWPDSDGARVFIYCCNVPIFASVLL